MADKWVQRWEVASHSNPSKTYTVAIDADGIYDCSCPAWTRHMPRKDCKHIQQVKAIEQAPKVTTTVPEPAPTPPPQRERKSRPATRLAYLEF